MNESTNLEVRNWVIGESAPQSLSVQVDIAPARRGAITSSIEDIEKY
ncbi:MULTISPECIES: hypothetical protein [Paraburkholderia]|nr:MULTISPECIES: hypothetical protein [Paraburkholderia]MCX4174548.1 hypothetical protein [Paraburkholderia madseniana]MDQ6462549.1 hypothetical protein [Paraburkholderia madseniana]